MDIVFMTVSKIKYKLHCPVIEPRMTSEQCNKFDGENRHMCEKLLKEQERCDNYRKFGYPYE